jgi:hypothetical protein
MIFFSIANKQEKSQKCIVKVTETAENNLSHRSVVNNKCLKFKTAKGIEKDPCSSLSRLSKIRNKNHKQKKKIKKLDTHAIFYCYARLLKIATAVLSLRRNSLDRIFSFSRIFSIDLIMTY